MVERPRETRYLFDKRRVIRKIMHKIALLGYPMEHQGQYKRFIWKF